MEYDNLFYFEGQLLGTTRSGRKYREGDRLNIDDRRYLVLGPPCTEGCFCQVDLELLSDPVREAIVH